MCQHLHALVSNTIHLQIKWNDMSRFAQESRYVDYSLVADEVVREIVRAEISIFCHDVLY